MIRDSRTATCDACGKKSVREDEHEGTLTDPDQRNYSREPWRGEGFLRCTVPIISTNAADWCAQTVDLCGPCWERFHAVVRKFFAKEVTK